MVATEVRKAIVGGELSPGEQIRQAEWAELLRVSRVPVREALKSLASEGILRHDHNRGYFVVRFGPSEVSQIYMLRRLVEAELIRTIEWPSRQRVARMRGIAEQVAASMLDTNRNMDRWNELDHRFLIELYSLSPLELVRAEAERLWTLSNVYRRLTALASFETTRKASRVYPSVVDALELRDRPKMIRLITTQRRGAEELFVRLLQQRSTPAGASRGSRVGKTSVGMG